MYLFFLIVLKIFKTTEQFDLFEPDKRNEKINYNFYKYKKLLKIKNHFSKKYDIQKTKDDKDIEKNEIKNNESTSKNCNATQNFFRSRSLSFKERKICYEITKKSKIQYQYILSMFNRLEINYQMFVMEFFRIYNLKDNDYLIQIKSTPLCFLVTLALSMAASSITFIDLQNNINLDDNDITIYSRDLIGTFFYNTNKISIKNETEIFSNHKTNSNKVNTMKTDIFLSQKENINFNEFGKIKKKFYCLESFIGNLCDSNLNNNLKDSLGIIFDQNWIKESKDESKINLKIHNNTKPLLSNDLKYIDDESIKVVSILKLKLS